MKPLKILIVEDNVDDAHFLKGALEHLNYEVTLSNNYDSGLEYINTQHFDLIILDIQLDSDNWKKDKNGIALAKAIQSNPKINTPFIFLTGMHDRAVFKEAKLTMPHTYLLKPFNALELEYVLELALFKNSRGGEPLGMNEAAPQDNFFFVKHQQTMYRVDPEDILYIEVEGKYCKLVLSDKRFICRQSLSQMKTMLSNDFLQVHRNYLLNTKSLSSINMSERTIYLKEGQLIPISTRFLESVKEQFKTLI